MKKKSLYLLSGLFSLFLPVSALSQTSPSAAAASQACTTTWDLDLIIRDRVRANRDTLTIGQASDATDNIDVACNESELPPPPPSPLFGVSMQLPDDVTYSKRDIRADADGEEWTIALGGNHPFYINWDRESLPSGVFFLSDNIDGSYVNVTMGSSAATVVRNREVTELLLTRYPESQCENITVSAGWNIISLPVDPVDRRVRAMFGRRARAYTYDDGYTAAQFMEAGVGYWMSFQRGTTLTICGQPAGTSVALESGWNLVGPHRDDMAVADLTTTPSSLFESSFYGFSSSYEVTDSLIAGQGYWVESSGAGVITVTDAGKRNPTNNFVYQEAPVDSSWATLDITSADGTSQKLYLSPNALSQDDKFEFEMPPDSPGRIFDARFHSNLQVAHMYAGPAAFSIEGNETPLTLSLENLPYNALQIQSTDNPNPVQVVLDDASPVTIPAGHHTFILELKPRSVALESPAWATEAITVHGNHPNPFSAGTELTFELHHATYVHLSLYNALGQQVDALVDATLPAGLHRIPVDGSALPAGLYFYRIETESRHIVRSMMRIQ